jgi:hypothetical protein
MADRDHKSKSKPSGDKTKSSKKRSKHDEDGRERKRRQKADKLQVLDDGDEDMWVEKNIDMEGTKVCVQCSHIFFGLTVNTFSASSR